MRIICDIVRGTRHNKGVIMQVRNFDFERLQKWVKRICPGCLYIDTHESHIEVTYNDRKEIYTLEIA